MASTIPVAWFTTQNSPGHQSWLCTRCCCCYCPLAQGLPDVNLFFSFNVHYLCILSSCWRWNKISFKIYDLIFKWITFKFIIYHHSHHIRPTSVQLNFGNKTRKHDEVCTLAQVHYSYFRLQSESCYYSKLINTSWLIPLPEFHCACGWWLDVVPFNFF